MADTDRQVQLFAAAFAAKVSQILEAHRDLDALVQRHFDLGIAYTDEHFSEIDGLKHLTAQAFLDGLTSASALATTMDAGHRANLNRVVG